MSLLATIPSSPKSTTPCHLPNHLMLTWQENYYSSKWFCFLFFIFSKKNITYHSCSTIFTPVGLLSHRTNGETQVRHMLHGLYDPLECMMMIDGLQCLRIDYQFRQEIEEILSRLYKNLGGAGIGHANNGLYDTTL